MATAANENDRKRSRASRAGHDCIGGHGGKIQGSRNLKFDNAKTTESVGKLGSSIATYTKQANGVVDMADGDRFGIDVDDKRSAVFTAIEKLIDDH